MKSCSLHHRLSLGGLCDSLISGMRHWAEYGRGAALDTVLPLRYWHLDPRDGQEHSRGCIRGSKVWISTQGNLSWKDKGRRGWGWGGIKEVGQKSKGIKTFPRGSQVLKDGREIADQACRGHSQNGNFELQLLPGQSWLIPKALALLSLDKLEGRITLTEHPLMRWDEQGQGYELIPH